MAGKSKSKKPGTESWNEPVLMRLPNGTEVEVPRKKVPVKVSWGWKVVEKSKPKK